MKRKISRDYNENADSTDIPLTSGSTYALSKKSGSVGRLHYDSELYCHQQQRIQHFFLLRPLGRNSSE